MLEPLEIAEPSQPLLAGAGSFAGKRVLITAGPTREAIDPVRFVSNRSSGKMGFAVAAGDARGGCRGRAGQRPGEPAAARRACAASSVESAAQMLDAVQRELPGTHVFVATAAVADYRPAHGGRRTRSRRRSRAARRCELTRTTDILATVAARAERPFVVGFAAETDAVEQHAREKLQRKNLDMIAANEVGREQGLRLRGQRAAGAVARRRAGRAAARAEA